MATLKFDLNIDKRQHATLVIECPTCRHENAHHLRALQPDTVVACDACDAAMTISAQDLVLAQQRLDAIVRNGG